MKQCLAAASLLLLRPPHRPAPAWPRDCRRSAAPYPPPFTATLSNNTPLAFGMSAEEAAFALGAPLNMSAALPGDEIFLAFRDSRRQRTDSPSATGSICNSARAGSPDGKATGAITGCGSSGCRAHHADHHNNSNQGMDDPWDKTSR